jgi:hypothetical protein
MRAIKANSPISCDTFAFFVLFSLEKILRGANVLGHRHSDKLLETLEPVKMVRSRKRGADEAKDDYSSDGGFVETENPKRAKTAGSSKATEKSEQYWEVSPR